MAHSSVPQNLKHAKDSFGSVRVGAGCFMLALLLAGEDGGAHAEEDGAETSVSVLATREAALARKARGALLRANAVHFSAAAAAIHPHTHASDELSWFRLKFLELYLIAAIYIRRREIPHIALHRRN